MIPISVNPPVYETHLRTDGSFRIAKSYPSSKPRTSASPDQVFGNPNHLKTPAKTLWPEAFGLKTR